MLSNYAWNFFYQRCASLQAVHVVRRVDYFQNKQKSISCKNDLVYSFARDALFINSRENFRFKLEAKLTEHEQAMTSLQGMAEKSLRLLLNSNW